MGLDQGGGEGRREQRADFESFQVLRFKSWVWRKAAGLGLASLAPRAALLPLPRCPGVALGGEVPRGRGGAGRAAGAPPPPPPRLLLFHPLSGRQLQAKKRKW